jgi:hypothetical protein
MYKYSQIVQFFLCCGVFSHDKSEEIFSIFRLKKTVKDDYDN